MACHAHLVSFGEILVLLLVDFDVIRLSDLAHDLYLLLTHVDLVEA
jgi:hypothetical protein